MNEVLLKLEGFQYDKSFDLNMGYYHIRTKKMQVTYVRLFSGGKILIQASNNGSR